MDRNSTIHQGKIWIIKDHEDKLIEDIDTDQIYHNAFLHITEISQMGKHAFGNLPGWQDFSEKADSGDIIVTGRNFGAGSSRQQAVDCFISLDIGLILASSFGAIYFRNAINSGFPILRCLSLAELVKGGKLESGDEIKLDFLDGTALNLSKESNFRFEPMNRVQNDIFRAGNLFNYGKAVLR
jgi:3-isopropylmalate/(R)-2-methylmalate dehydratase small subunit